MNHDKQNNEKSNPDNNPGTDRPHIFGPAFQRFAADSALFGCWIRFCGSDHGGIRVIGQRSPEILSALPEKGVFKISSPQQTGVASLRDIQLSCQILNAFGIELWKHGLDQQTDGDETDFSLMPEALEQDPEKLQSIRFCNDNLIGQNP